MWTLAAVSRHRGQNPAMKNHAPKGNYAVFPPNRRDPHCMTSLRTNKRPGMQTKACWRLECLHNCPSSPQSFNGVWAKMYMFSKIDVQFIAITIQGGNLPSCKWHFQWLSCCSGLRHTYIVTYYTKVFENGSSDCERQMFSSLSDPSALKIDCFNCHFL